MGFEQRSEALQELGEGRHAPGDGPMPSEAEVLAMIPILWTERTAFPGQSHDTANSSGDTFRFVDKPTQLTDGF